MAKARGRAALDLARLAVLERKMNRTAEHAHIIYIRESSHTNSRRNQARYVQPPSCTRLDGRAVTLIFLLTGAYPFCGVCCLPVARIFSDCSGIWISMIGASSSITNTKTPSCESHKAGQCPPWARALLRLRPYVPATEGRYDNKASSGWWSGSEGRLCLGRFTGGCVLTASWCESDEGMPPRPENRSARSPGKPAAGKTTASSQNRRYTLSVCLSLSKPLLVDCSGGGLQRCAILWLMNASFLVDSVGRPTSLPPHFSSIPLPFPLFLPILHSLSSSSFPLFLILPSLEWPWRGATGRPRCRLRGGGAATKPGTTLGPRG